MYSGILFWHTWYRFDIDMIVTYPEVLNWRFIWTVSNIRTRFIFETYTVYQWMCVSMFLYIENSNLLSMHLSVLVILIEIIIKTSLLFRRFFNKLLDIYNWRHDTTYISLISVSCQCTLFRKVIIFYSTDMHKVAEEGGSNNLLGGGQIGTSKTVIETAH